MVLKVRLNENSRKKAKETYKYQMRKRKDEKRDEDRKRDRDKDRERERDREDKGSRHRDKSKSDKKEKNSLTADEEKLLEIERELRRRQKEESGDSHRRNSKSKRSSSRRDRHDSGKKIKLENNIDKYKSLAFTVKNEYGYPDDPDYDKYAKPSKPQDNRRENDQRDHEKSSSHRGSYRDECHDKIKEEGRKEKDRHRDHDKSRNNDKRDGRDTEDRDRDRRQKEKHKDDYSSERRGEKDSHRDKNYQNEKRRTSKEKHDHEPKDMWVGPKDEKWSQRMKHFLNEMVDYMDYLKKKGGKDAKYYEAKKKWEKENQKYDEFLKSKDKHKSQTDHHSKNDGGKSPSSKKEEKRQQRSESRAETTKTGTATETEATTQDSSDEDMNIVIGKNSVKFNGFSSDSSLSSDEERSKKQSGKKKRTGTTEEPVLPKIAKMTMPEPMGDNNVVPNQMVHPLVLPNGQVIPPGFQIPGLNTPFHFPGLPAYPNLPGLGYHQQMQQQAVVAAQSNNQILVQPPPVVPAPLVQTPQPVASAVPAPPLPVTSTFNSSSLRTLNRVQIDEADLKATMNESPDKIILSSSKGSIDYDLLKQKSDRVICLKGLKDDVPDRFFYGYKRDVQSALEAKYGIKIDQFLGSAGRKVGYIVLGSANEADLLYKKEGYRLKELNTTVTFYRFKGRHKKDVSPERKVEDSGNKSVPNFTVKIQNDDSSTKLAPENIKINVNNNLAKPNSTNSIMNQLADSLRKSRQTVAIDHQKRANITMTSSQEELLDMALAPQAAVTTGKIKQETPTSLPQQQHQPVAQIPTNLPKMLPAKLMAVNTQANTSRILDPSLYEKPIKAKTEAPLPAAPEPAYIPKIRTSHNTRVTQGLLPTSERFAKIQLKDEQQSDERLKESNSQEESAPIRLDKHGRPVRISSNAYSRKPELDRETTTKNIKQECAQPEQPPQEAIKPISKPEPKANTPIKAEVNQEPTPAEPSPKNDKGISQANNSLFMDKSLDLSARIKNNPPPLANYNPNGKVEPLIKTEVAQKPQPVLSNEEAQKQALMYLQKEREKQLQQQHRDPRFGTTQNFAQNWQSQPYQAALLPGAPPGPPQGGYQMPPPSQPMNTNGPWGNNNLSNKKYNKVEDMFRELESETTKMSKDKIPQQKINLLGVDIPDQYFNEQDIDKEDERQRQAIKERKRLEKEKLDKLKLEKKRRSSAKSKDSDHSDVEIASDNEAVLSDNSFEARREKSPEKKKAPVKQGPIDTVLEATCKEHLLPFYKNKQITKDQYKQIMKTAVKFYMKDSTAFSKKHCKNFVNKLITKEIAKSKNNAKKRKVTEQKKKIVKKSRAESPPPPPPPGDGEESDI